VRRRGRRGRRVRVLSAVLTALAALVVVFVTVGLTAANSVPPTNVGSGQRPIGANDVKPAACAGLNLTRVVTGAGTVNGTGRDELLLGSPGIDLVRGRPGNDCLLGGGGLDILNGEQGSDVCIGGPGLDIFTAACEVQIQ
jgi:Ca2+-binding RTX toxin-like protein